MRSFLEGGSASLRRRARIRGKASARLEWPQSVESLRLRLRRNRELQARESLAIALWLMLSGMLLYLARSMVDFAQAQRIHQGNSLRIALPLVPLIGALGSLWRSWLSLREWRRIQGEQRALWLKLREAPDH